MVLLDDIVRLLTSLVSAELFSLLVRSPDIQMICKKCEQRKPAEQQKIGRGLVRSLVLELILFVPTSVALLFLIARPFLLLVEPMRTFAQGPSGQRFAFDGLIGIVSYGFPFVSLRSLVTQMALRH